MSNPAAVVALTYDGTDIQQDPIGIFLELVGGPWQLPSVRGTDTIVPALAGRIARNRLADTWRIPLLGYVSGTGTTEADQRAAFAAARAALRTLFDPTRAPADLVATTEDGSTWTISARPLATALWDQKVPSMAAVSYELEAVQDWVVT